MTTLVRWNPFTEFSGLRQAMGILEDYAPARIWRNTEPADLSFATDLFETDEHIVVKAVLPGVKPEEVDISVSEGVLTIKGETRSTENTEGENFYRREIRYGAFARSIPLPTRVVHEQAEAGFENGILTVTLPKAEEVRPKTIKVKPRTEAQGELVGAASGGNSRQP